MAGSPRSVWGVPLGVILVVIGGACGGLTEILGQEVVGPEVVGPEVVGPEVVGPGGSAGATEAVSTASVSPGEFRQERLTVSFPPGSTAGERLVVTKAAMLPAIYGRPEEMELYDQLRLVGDAWEITDPAGATGPFRIELGFDPAAAGTDELFLLAVSKGKVVAPRPFAADVGEGYVIAEGDHFSTWFVVAATASLATLVYVAWQAHSFTSNETAPWNLIDEDHAKIKAFITDNGLTMPSAPPGTERVRLPNYTRVFGGRSDNVGNRVVHLIGKRGSEVLDETQVACWDLTTLFASVLYTLDPDIGPRIRLVKGTLDGGRHSWIEVVIDGQVFVVNTARTDAFEFVARDVLYAEQKLVPSHTYTKDPGSLRAYDPKWFEPLLGADGATLARIEALRARHAALQGELEALAANGTSISAADEARMDAIRVEQKGLYTEVMALKKTLAP